MIAIEVAAGIVLAYVLIVNQRRLLRVAGWCLSMILVASILLAVGWGGSTALSEASAHWPAIWGKLGTLVGCIIGFGAFLAGGYGLIVIARSVLRTNRPVLDSDGNGPAFVVGGFGLVNMLLVYAVSWPMLSYTALGNWYDAADTWSRMNGHADVAAMVIAAVAWLWSVPVAWFLFKRAASLDERRSPIATEHLLVRHVTQDLGDGDVTSKA